MKGSQVGDVVLDVLTRTTYQQMDDATEREVLKGRLVEEINASGILEAGEVSGIYFERFILQ